MIRIGITQFRCLCFVVVVAAAGFSAMADSSTITSGSSAAFRANFVSKGRFQDPGSLGFVTRELEYLMVRGGSDDDMDEYDEYDNEPSDDERIVDDVSSDFVGITISKSKKALALVGSIVTKLSKHSINAIKRAIKAGLESHDTEEAEDTGFVPKIFDVTIRMMKAAFNIGESIEDDTEGKSSDEVEGLSEEKQDSVVETKGDFGPILSKAYGVIDNRGEDGPAILGGSLTGALEIAKSQARMLVIFLPVRKPFKGKKSKDNIAIESILSFEVAQAANKRASKKGGETGSFLFWAANAGSPESAAAMKRLKGKLTSQKGDKRPVLAVAFPLLSVAGGKTKLVPKILAQHHCSPPPAESVMAAWLDSLRKRHAKLYAKMQTDLKEAEFYKERKEGYSESVKSDNQRKQRQKEAAVEREAKEQAEKERQEAVEARRVELRESLSDEDTSNDAKKIALRFQDGQSGQRQFSPDSPVSDLFNWVDAIFEMEREKVVLTSMNGKISLKWDEETNGKLLKDIGLGKNTGFRVSEAQDDEKKGDEEEKEEEKEKSS